MADLLQALDASPIPGPIFSGRNSRRIFGTRNSMAGHPRPVVKTRNRPNQGLSHRAVGDPDGVDPVPAAAPGCRTCAFDDLLQSRPRRRAVESPSNLARCGFPAGRFELRPRRNGNKIGTEGKASLCPASRKTQRAPIWR